jgi:hypothetical protein
MRIVVEVAGSRISELSDQPIPKGYSTKDLATAHCRIASLAVALMMSFLLLAYFDPQLFFIHFYESLIYLVIVAMIFHVADRWTYMLGMLAPALWLALMSTPGACALLFFTFGGIPEILRPIQLVFRLQRTSVPATLLGTLILILSVSMFIVCATRWRRESARQANGWSTFLVCVVVVGIYYGTMVLWALRYLATVA